MKGLYRFAFLLSSFGPLFLILAAKTALDPQAPPYGLWTFIILFALSIAAFVITVLGLKRSAAQIHMLTDLKPRDSDIFPYLMTYIPSLIFRDLYNPAIGVLILAPDMRGQKVIERRNRSAPADRLARFEELGVLVKHGVDDVNEGLVT